MKSFLHLSILIILMACAKEEQSAISQKEDYSPFLNIANEDTTHLIKRVSLWKGKIENQPKGFIYYEKLGGIYNQLFEQTAEVEYLHKAKESFTQAEKLTRGKWKISSLLSLSSLSIKKHDFKSAANYAVNAREITNEKFGALMMQFDAEMELGNYKMAGAILRENKRFDSFDYLVRLSKFKDYEGDLDSAIHYMEKADIGLFKYQKGKKLWVTANLGDMYGHAGRVKDSYKKYLETLSMDSTYDYALKGIAWVAYSADKNVDDAKKIIMALADRRLTPDLYLNLAEIYAFEGNTEMKELYEDSFLKEVEKEKYGDMYNKYLISIYNDRKMFEKAKGLAQLEINNRPTPASYDWLAWTLYNQGESDKALKIYKENVEGQTYEPEALYHMGTVYHEMDQKAGRKLLEESLEASYELGPLISLEIKEKLNG
ncbi:tetratricopeptide repeat protein [Ekhidna sp.]